MTYPVKNLNTSTFVGNTLIKTVDLSNTPWVDNNMTEAFNNCQSLKTVTNINSSVSNVSLAFVNCRNMTDTPTLPASVINMYGTFYNCTNLVNAVLPTDSVIQLGEAFRNCSNLVNAPSLPNYVVAMARTFWNCTKLVNVPDIPDSVAGTIGTFDGCSNLVTAPNIGSSTVNMYETFNRCAKLTGDIRITSTEVGDATNCFNGSSLVKNVFIPFTYENTVHTRTYNSFIAAGYDTEGTVNNVFLKDSTSYEYATVTINPVPSDATVTYDVPGYTQVGNSITVLKGTNVIYTVSREGYDSKAGNFWGNWDRTETVTLTKKNFTLTINPTPSDATVVLTASGYTQSGNSITVPYQTNVTYTISKTNYTTVSNTISLESTQTLNVTLVQNGFTLTINPTPSDATVLLEATGYSQSGNSIVVPQNTSVTWTVSKTGYTTQSNTVSVSQDQTLNITLVSSICSLTVNPIPSDANVSLTDLTTSSSQSGSGTQTLSTEIGHTVRAVVSKSGYTSKTMDIPMTGNTTMNITLEANMATITLVTNAPNPTIVLSAIGYTQVGNSITVPAGTRVDYIVSATGYNTRQNTIFADVDKTYEIILTPDAEAVTLTIAPKPKTTQVTINCTGYDTVSGQGTQSITVAKNSPVTYTVSYGGQTLQVTSSYPLYVSNDMLIEYDMTIQHVNHTLTYQDATTSGNHLIGTFMYKSIEGTMVVGPTDATRGTPLFFPKGYQVYLVFHTENFSHTVGSTSTYNTGGGSSYGIRINKILTVNFSPSDAVVTVVDGAGNVIPAKTESAGQNTYYFPYYHSGTTEFYNNTCNITVSRAGYVSQSTTATRQYASDGSVTVNLNPA